MPIDHLRLGERISISAGCSDPHYLAVQAPIEDVQRAYTSTHCKRRSWSWSWDCGGSGYLTNTFYLEAL